MSHRPKNGDGKVWVGKGDYTSDTDVHAMHDGGPHRIHVVKKTVDVEVTE